jgi:hypothetical protein
MLRKFLTSRSRSPLRYFGSNKEVKIGDKVEVKRLIRPNLQGMVIYVYNPNEPSIPNGNNPTGYTIKIKKDEFIFVSKLDKRVILKERQGS